MHKKQKKLIIVADDFGYHPWITDGIIDSFNKKAITSASVMIDTEEKEKIKTFVKHNPHTDLGIHLSIHSTDISVRTLIKDFIRQYKVYYDTFRKKPSNFSLHHGSDIRTQSHHASAMAAISIALNMFEEQTMIPNRYTCIDSSHTFLGIFPQNPAKELISILNSLHEGVHMLITHPAIQKSPETNAFHSAYTLSKRTLDHAALTSPTIAAILKNNSITLVDFTDATKGRRIYENQKK